MEKIGFGGSCHWCTEAIFLSLKGVTKVEQGWIAANDPLDSFSEAVTVYYDTKVITLENLITVHLYTHSCTSAHQLRSKYRSAIYTTNEAQENIAKKAILALQKDFDEQIITLVLPFQQFKINSEQYRNYYFKDPKKPFCENIVNPKLKELLTKFSQFIDHQKLRHLSN